MDRATGLALLGFVISLSRLILKYERSFVFERPVQSSIAVCALSGWGIIALQKAFPQLWYTPIEKERYAAIPLEDIEQDQPTRQPLSPASKSRFRGHLRWVLGIIVLLVAAICARVEVLRRLVLDNQCAGPDFQELIPLVLAIFDVWSFRHHGPVLIEARKDDSVYQAIGQAILNTRFRYILPVTLLSFGSLIFSVKSSKLHSSYICARVLSNAQTIPRLQLAGFFLDTVIVVALSRIYETTKDDKPGSMARFPVIAASALVLSSVVLCVEGYAVYYFKPEDRYWILTLHPAYRRALADIAFSVLVCVLCGLVLITRVGFTSIAVAVLFSCSYLSSLSSALGSMRPFPPVVGGTFLSVLLMFAGLMIYIQIDYRAKFAVKSSGETTSNRVVKTLYVVLFGMFIVRVSVWFKHASKVSFHPIDMLIYEGRLQHEAWLVQASSSRNLYEAISNYRLRYKREPPPLFDKWYEFATARSSKVIDEFDRIQEDTMPYWALSPAEVRLRTWEAMSNPWNDIGGITIRNGTADIAPNVMPTHRWMLEGVIRMIEQFSSWLPDMDLAFNLNDECRVALPWQQFEQMRSDSLQVGDPDGPQLQRFSEDRAQGWPAISEEPIPNTRFHERSHHPTFYEFGSIGCPPWSRARTAYQWKVRELCVDCTYPHSLGQFISNWTLAADICHQPDLANSHGFYLSPAAFKASHDLMPVFSQSKAHGYSDLLYPSAWNYLDKVVYAPTNENPDLPFTEKEPVLFWRGATSEGVSPGTGTWRGMARQRLVHLANKARNDAVVLLPQPVARKSDKTAYAYSYLSPKDLETLGLSTDIQIVEAIARCGGHDCDIQHQEFSPLAPPLDFQSHWRYKYLMDLDGAGFSGRFLPFLQSRSLIFKTALFREWWDDRVTAWRHFVPVDVRLHGLWSTLAYFKGVNGIVKGRETLWEAHDKEGEMIAEEGRAWAAQVLRKEDMEVYFFRLLLEWGRLTDDNRDKLGFSL